VTAGPAPDRDPIAPLYKATVAMGVVAIVILAAGLAEFLYFEPPGQRTGTTARVEGVYRYDPKTMQTSGGDSKRFQSDQTFAAVVDWSSLPSDLVVAARWYNSFSEVVGEVGPKRAGELGDDRAVPVKVPEGLTRNLPGQYMFVVERFKGDQPVEVLARRFVVVRRHLTETD
jgi:hypothetical protein